MSISTKQSFWVLLLLWTPFSLLVGQACGCLDCPAAVPVNFNNFQLAYQVDGASNNELASNNCIESINIKFKHNRVQNLTLELISPAGQIVSLVGNYQPFGGGLASTIGATWDVHFVSCAATAAPDPGLAPYWDNLNPAWNVFFGSFEGTYYPPFGNCLENFNAGTVNGMWQLNVTNYDFPEVTGTGVIEDFTINFCDETGINCCFPDGGILNNASPLTFCETELINLPDLSSNFSEAFDSSGYYYEYILSRNDRIIDIDTSFNLEDSIAGDYVIQGLAYAKTDSLDVVNLIGSFASTLDTDLGLLVPPFCAELSENRQEISLLVAPDTVFQIEQICAGERITIAGEDFEETGIYEVLFPAAVGCDTVLQLQLEVFSSDTTRLNRQICTGERIAVGGQNFDSTGQYNILLQNRLGCDSVVLLDLSVEQLNAFIQPVLPLTCAAPTTNLLGNTSGGNTLRYEWFLDENSIGTDSILIVDRAGNYHFLVENNAGCIARDSIQVESEQAFPIAEAGATDTLNCINTELELDGTSATAEGTLAYTWTLPDGSQLNEAIVRVSEEGLYYLDIRNLDNGCMARDSVSLLSNQNPPDIELTENDTLTCLKNEIVLHEFATEETGISYNWETLNGAFLTATNRISPRINRSGLYILTAQNTENGCITRDSIFIVETAERPIANVLKNAELSCLNPSITLDATNSSIGSFLAYTWTSETGDIVSGSTTLSPVVAATGTYILSVQNTETGCTAQDSVFVSENSQQAEIDLLPLQTLNCNRTSYQIELGSLETDVVYTWTDIDGIFLTNEFEPNLLLGTYHLEAMHIQSGCTANASIRIEQAAPPMVAIRDENRAVECLDLRVNLQAETEDDVLQYTWLDAERNPLATTENIEVTEAGTYYLEVFDAQTRCVATDSILVAENNALSIQGADLIIQQLDCLEQPLGSIEISSVQGGQAPFLYSINSAIFSSNNRFSALEADAYEVRVQDVQGCEWDTLVYIERLPDLELELGDMQRIELGESIDLNPQVNSTITSFLWSSSKATLACPTCNTQTIAPLESTTYQLQVVDENGCTATDEIQIIVVRSEAIYIPTAFSPNEDGQNDIFEIYPKSNAVEAIEEILIFNRWGELVFEQQAANSSRWDGRYKGQNLPAGLYVVSASVRYIDDRVERVSGAVNLIR